MSRVLDRVRKDVCKPIPPDESDSDRRYRETYLHPCAVPTCGLWIAKGYVACAPHYMCLPTDVRAALAVVFRNRVAAPDRYEHAVRLTRRLLGAQS